LYELGFKKSNFEIYIFVKAFNKSLIIIALYVNDFLIFLNDKNKNLNLKELTIKEQI